MVFRVGGVGVSCFGWGSGEVFVRGRIFVERILTIFRGRTRCGGRFRVGIGGFGFFLYISY